MRFFVLIFLLIFVSCNKQETKQKQLSKKYSKETLENINKQLVNKDSELIKSYVQRRNWDMKPTQTGLWYMILDKGNEKTIEKNNHITYNYNIRLLNGNLCYSSDSLGAKSIVVGQGGVESGLEEGILLLNEKGKARFIIPPHLAHGLIGDNNHIPARAILIYDIEILKVKP